MAETTPSLRSLEQKALFEQRSQALRMADRAENQTVAAMVCGVLPSFPGLVVTAGHLSQGLNHIYETYMHLTPDFDKAALGMAAVGVVSAAYMLKNAFASDRAKSEARTLYKRATSKSE